MIEEAVARPRARTGRWRPSNAVPSEPTIAEMARHVDTAQEEMNAVLAEVDPDEMAQLLALLRDSTVA